MKLIITNLPDLIQTKIDSRIFNKLVEFLKMNNFEEGWVWVFLDPSNGYAGVHGFCQTPSAGPTEFAAPPKIDLFLPARRLNMWQIQHLWYTIPGIYTGHNTCGKSNKKGVRVFYLFCSVFC
ncbi:Hypothetical_protein [Hexamita inflata]|uniref:Hypothetical_protein n=1 Tax=Hexamita inflata TaxID=28002 RepID=A0AA86U3N8_9EUKA|nr:Hypothetical protein HINF_LOCUS27029 [Hexamita inflata]